MDQAQMAQGLVGQCDVCALFQTQRVLSKGALCSLVSIGGFLHLYDMLPTKSNWKVIIVYVRGSLKES